MALTWDEAKRRANLKKHGVDFAAAAEFEWDTVLESTDDSHGEVRWVATGFIGSKLYVLVYAETEETIRVISLRRATKREIVRYVEAQS
jgi:uncharacterized DUF497 family protein